PRTWAMWARYHPAVKNCKILLYPVKQEMDNPWYEIPAFRVGGSKSPSRGVKLNPKLDVVTPYGRNYGGPAATSAGGLPPAEVSETETGEF
ncbi:unnamed protein product, partial [marine sediment metagenome]